MSILDTLVAKNVIRQADIPKVLGEVDRSGEPIESVLVAMGVPAEAVLAAKAEATNIPTRSLATTDVPFAVLKLIPEESASHYRFVPIAVKDGVLEVGVLDPENIEARDALNFIASKVGMPYKIFLITQDDFEKVIKAYKGISGEVTKALTELDTEIAEDIGKVPDVTNDSAERVETKIIEDAPVTKIVATILRYATEGNASDVHIEHMRDKVRVRFRVDGTLNTSLVLPINVHAAIVARIKILSNMKLDEKRKPQDGRFSAKIEGRKIDFRVSTFPAYYGEKVVMRILDQEKGVKPLDQMGLSPEMLAMVRRAIAAPYGMILISGPTGSGKTTTLYSMLGEINKEEKNVLSLEDPIEYNIEGMSQSQVHPEIGYTFAAGLRTTLRQDPDVIMVGEIRDKETAQLAIQAALTGHLVLSTIHTNSAVGVIPRLVDMGIEPFLIAPTLVLTMAQRLVSTLCPGTGKAMPVEGSIKTMIDKQFGDMPEEYRKKLPLGPAVYEKEASAECPNGTRGRTAVFEMFEMDKELEKAILKDPTEVTISEILRKRGMITMREDAILKSMGKIVPFEETSTL
jgi:type IV pilus assembly protein PilB